MALHEPKQDRSRRTLDRLASSALTLIARQGVQGTSVAELVAHARSSIGSFYARFDSKDDFVEYLEKRVWEDAIDRWDRAVAGIRDRQLGTAELVGGVVRLLVQTGRADLEQRRALRSNGGPPDLALRFHAHVLAGISDLLRDRAADFGHPDPDRAIRLGYQVIAGSLDHLAAMTARDPLDDEEELVAELSRLYLAYLGSTALPVRRPTARPADAQPRDEPPDPTPADPEPDALPDTDPIPVPTDAPEPERVDFFDIWG